MLFKQKHITKCLYSMEKIKYTSLNTYLKNTYGEKLYKISLDIGLSCPNRDGTLGTEGCAFCSAGGSGDFAVKCNTDNIHEMIDKAKERVASKSKSNRYIAYFQAYSNTYGPIEYLRQIFFATANRSDIAIISIATRCDCINDDVLELLVELNKIKPVWLEMGMQTSYNNTLEQMNCGYTFEDFRDTVERLSNAGIEVIAHLIIGLPGETEKMILTSVSGACSLPIKGIKLSMLHLLKNTKLAQIYEKQPFHIYTLEEYCVIISRCLEIIPKDIVVHRITGDGPKNLLIEPKWSGDKKKVLNTLSKYITPS